MILDTELNEFGLIERSFPLEDKILALVESENWRELDQYFLAAEKKEGLLFKYMQSILEFESMEHIIAIREAPHDEDGIWHDDGSRILGYSLSLTKNNEDVKGGELRFRKKGEKDFKALTTRAMGKILIFKTGIYGYEHMVSAVKEGRRIVIAGWCS